MADSTTSARHSRRHLLKAAGIVAGVAGSYVPAKASADCLFGIVCIGSGGSGSGSGTSGGTSTQCFLRGMRVRTSKGYRRIETLEAGDLMPTRFSGLLPIRRIDSFTVHRTETGDWPAGQRMIRVERGALADNVPSADLYVTESHAFFLDGALVRISSLANGVTIAFDDATERDSLDFFHVEFDRHEVIEAEGAPCESLQATGMAACMPILEFHGGRSELGSRLRSAAAPLIDRRRPLDRIRDEIESRASL